VWWYAHLPWVCRPLDTLFAPLSGMMDSIRPLLYLLPCDVMHTYSQVCRTSCWCYTYLLPSMLNPLLLLCMLTPSMYAPLTTYFPIFLVVWWSTSWPFVEICSQTVHTNSPWCSPYLLVTTKTVSLCWGYRITPIYKKPTSASQGSSASTSNSLGNRTQPQNLIHLSVHEHPGWSKPIRR
jgi:hypothetical protein